MIERGKLPKKGRGRKRRDGEKVGGRTVTRLIVLPFPASKDVSLI
jgi:hypothetical protein